MNNKYNSDKVKKISMKNKHFLITLILIAVLITITACGKEKNNGTGSTSGNTGTCDTSGATDFTESTEPDLTLDYKTVQEINENCDIVFEFMRELSPDEAKQAGYDTPFCDGLPDGSVNVYGMPYPNDSSKSYITQVDVEKPGKSVYGIQVGDSVDKVSAPMAEFGYEFEDEGPIGFTINGADTSVKYKKGNVHIDFNTYDDVIKRIHICIYQKDESEEEYVY